MIMFKEIKQTEVNITKSLEASPVADRIAGLVDMYREVSKLLYKTEELKDKVYPELRSQFEEVFDEQDRAVSRVLQVGNIIATMSKDSVRAGTESIDLEKFIADVHKALPDFEDIIKKNLDAAYQLTRIQVSPSLYVLNKQTSDPERIAPFLESAAHSLLKENFDGVLAKIKPFMDKMYRLARGSAKKADAVFDQYIKQYVVERQPVLAEDEEAQPSNPYVVQIKRLKSKATATIDPESEFAGELLEHINGFEDIQDIIERSTELKSKISNELKEEMVELFSEEERAYNNIIDMGENIVAFTSVESSRKSSDKVIAAKFMELLAAAIPEATAIIEDLYIANKTISESTVVKNSIRTSRGSDITESIGKIHTLIKRVVAFVAKAVSIISPKQTKIEQLNSNMKKLLSKMQPIEENVDVESQVETTPCFCVYQDDVAVFGVGATEDDALKSASEWVDVSDRETFKIAKCSADLADYFNINGTPDKFGLSDGIMKIQ